MPLSILSWGVVVDGAMIEAIFKRKRMGSDADV